MLHGPQMRLMIFRLEQYNLSLTFKVQILSPFYTPIPPLTHPLYPYTSIFTPTQHEIKFRQFSFFIPLRDPEYLPYLFNSFVSLIVLYFLRYWKDYNKLSQLIDWRF